VTSSVPTLCRSIAPGPTAAARRNHERSVLVDRRGTRRGAGSRAGHGQCGAAGSVARTERCPGVPRGRIGHLGRPGRLRPRSPGLFGQMASGAAPIADEKRAVSGKALPRKVERLGGLGAKGAGAWPLMKDLGLQRHAEDVRQPLALGPTALAAGFGRVRARGFLGKGYCDVSI
jgi:hypothetical protein